MHPNFCLLVIYHNQNRDEIINQQICNYGKSKVTEEIAVSNMNS